MAEYKIVTWRAAFMDWRVDVYLGGQHVMEGSGYSTRGMAVRTVKRRLREAFKPAKENSFHKKEEWFNV